MLCFVVIKYLTDVVISRPKVIRLAVYGPVFESFMSAAQLTALWSWVGLNTAYYALVVVG